MHFGAFYTAWFGEFLLFSHNLSCMPITLLGDFFSLINIPMFDSMTVLLIVSFIVWETPRMIRILSEEYTRGLYPEEGRVADFFLFFIGLLSIGYFSIGSNAEHIVAFLKTPGITMFFLILMAAIPILIALGFFKRFFSRIDRHQSVAIFLAQAFLDLMHTIFHIALVVILVPAAGYLIFGAG